MSRFWLFAAAAAGALLLAACAPRSGSSQGQASSPASSNSMAGNASSPAAKASVTLVSPEEVHTMLQNGEDFLLVDVRTAEEYAAGHIPGAILIPNETIADSQPTSLPDLDAKIAVYCRSGRRSADAAAKLAAMGYTQLYDLGGINSWPYETVAGSSPAGEEAAK